MMSVSLPWWLKITSKIVLSRLPLRYGLWQRMGLFKHGKMDQSAYVLGLFNEHVSRAGGGDDLSGKTILELGPGDSIATALVAASQGARAILVDAGDFAHANLQVYRDLATALQNTGLTPPDISRAESREAILRACHSRYLTEGLTSLRSIPTNSVDILFSHAVLEHIRRNEFLPTLRECHRILKPTGGSSHNVDLKDHLDNSLNNLRFSHKTWESSLFAKSGFYTNRICYPVMTRLFEQAGFTTAVHGLNRWPQLPIKRQALAKEFVRYSDHDLTVADFDVVLYKRPQR